MEELTGTPSPLTSIGRMVARRMTDAWAIPVFHLAIDVDMTASLAVRERSPEATVTDVLIEKLARALMEHPSLNAHFADDTVTVFERINIGVAVAMEKGLIVPVVHGAEALNLAGIADARRGLVTRARAGRLGVADVTAGTFTVSNLGMFGVNRFDAILNPPQVAILAVGSTTRRQVWRDDAPHWTPVAELTLTCDHRAVDGATGARFLATLRELLEAAPAVRR